MNTSSSRDSSPDPLDVIDQPSLPPQRFIHSPRKAKSPSKSGSDKRKSEVGNFRAGGKKRRLDKDVKVSVDDVDFGGFEEEIVVGDGGLEDSSSFLRAGYVDIDEDQDDDENVDGAVTGQVVDMRTKSLEVIGNKDEISRTPGVSSTSNAIPEQLDTAEMGLTDSVSLERDSRFSLSQQQLQGATEEDTEAPSTKAGSGAEYEEVQEEIEMPVLDLPIENIEDHAMGAHRTISPPTNMTSELLETVEADDEDEEEQEEIEDPPARPESEIRMEENLLSASQLNSNADILALPSAEGPSVTSLNQTDAFRPSMQNSAVPEKEQSPQQVPPGNTSSVERDLGEIIQPASNIGPMNPAGSVIDNGDTPRLISDDLSVGDVVNGVAGNDAPPEDDTVISNDEEPSLVKSEPDALLGEGEKGTITAIEPLAVKTAAEPSILAGTKTKTTKKKDTASSKTAKKAKSKNVVVEKTEEAVNPVVDEEEPVEPADDAVYCICKKPYNEEDDDVVMVGCDA